ncbi:hypothetical protein EG68_02315 [Paragonimus skrjabini miyazakii]|uniref:SP-RING-type domain-containing protein n=1 Tax=Paragonimus skrjabini miyazakii TaxID=59628 RepID=A0A8S9Z818_9TREM|nr:hypothetical protein EG68_02315 [Paragonimus skrjabini miyazakii]
MSGQNIPNGQNGPGFSLNFYLSQLQTSAGSIPVSQAHSHLVAHPRNNFVSCHPNHNADTQTSRTTGSHVDKPIGKCDPFSAEPGAVALQNLIQSIHFLTASSTIPNVTVLSSGGVLPANSVGGFQPHAVLNNLFQSLLRGQVPVSNSNLSMLPVNVSGYVNTVASSGSGGRFVPGSKPSPTLSDTSTAHVPQLVSRRSTPQTTTVLQTTNSVSIPSGSSRNKQHHQILPNANSRLSVHSVSSLEDLFHPSNLSTTQIGSVKLSTEHKIQKLNAMAFLRWASNCTRSFRRDRISPWPHSQADVDALHGMNWVVAPSGLLGIYSESPFLRPVLLLRRVQFATPGSVVANYPDTDNMVRTLRDLADAKVVKNQRFSPCFPRSAATVGLCTDCLSYVFTLDLDRLLVKVLSDQAKAGARYPGPEWRVILRFGWATSDFYVPPSPSDKGPRRYRALVLESLPRCLGIRVAGRPINLPDPIFHGGQAQRLGKRLRLSIDITDKLPVKSNAPIRNRFVDIEVNWLHAPLEDQSIGLLDLVADGQISPLLCHLIGLPLIQVTLDRVYTIADLRTTFRPSDKISGAPSASVIDGPLVEGPNKNDIFPLMYNTDGTVSDLQNGVYGAYDNCIPPSRRITASSAKSALRFKFETSADDDLCITDGGDCGADYIPICLLCPLTRTRIEHLQCFDLTSYLTINRRRPRWSCPICGALAPFRDLRLDELFNSILEDPRTVAATFVHVDANGEWRLAPEESTDGHHNAATQPTVVGNTGLGGNDASADTRPANKVISSQPPVLSGPNVSPSTTPLDNSGVSVKPQSVSTVANAETAGDDKEVDVIILSDDDGEERAETIADSSALQHNSFVTHELISPSKRDFSEPPVSQSSANNNPSHHPTASEPHPMQIDLTNDDSDECVDEDSRTPSTTSTTSHTSGITTMSAPCYTNALSMYEDERLRNSRPLILISPLPPIVNGADASETQAMPSGKGPQPPAGSYWMEPPVLEVASGKSVTGANVNGTESDSPLYRHLFDTFSQRMDGPNKLSHLARTMATTTSTKAHQTSLTTAQPLDSEKQRQSSHSSQRNSGSSREFAVVRPVASFLEHSSNANDCVPGLDLSDYSDDENDFVATATPVFPGPSSSVRDRPPLLKMSQSAALARLIQQRSSRHPPRVANSTASSNSVGGSRSTKKPARAVARRGGGSQPSGDSHSRTSRSTKRPRRNSGRSRRLSPSEEETESSGNDSFMSSEMSCVSASEPSRESSCTPLTRDSDEDDDVSDESNSSDDRWSPSRHTSVQSNRRGKRRLLHRR